MINHQIPEQNSMAEKHQLVAVGDVHGCPHSLEALLNKLSSYHSSTFVFLGDYIDRGPDSKSVIDLLIDFSRDVECIMLRGNHEQMMIDALASGDTSLWFHNGGRDTLLSYGNKFTNPDLPAPHYHFIHNTKMYYESENYFFVHAGLPADMKIKEAIANQQIWQEFLWQRSHLDVDHPNWEKRVVFGHTPIPEPLITEYMIGVDTGCVFPNLPGLGYLTAVVLPEQEFIAQHCLDQPRPY